MIIRTKEERRLQIYEEFRAEGEEDNSVLGKFMIFNFDEKYCENVGFILRMWANLGLGQRAILRRDRRRPRSRCGGFEKWRRQRNPWWVFRSFFSLLNTSQKVNYKDQLNLFVKTEGLKRFILKILGPNAPIP